MIRLSQILSLILIIYSCPTQSLDNDLVDRYLAEIRLVDDYFIQYDALITATRYEVDTMAKEVLARWLSRTGFVFDEMRISENRSRLLIGERSAEIGENTDCILEATDRLNEAVEIVGNGSFDVHTTIINQLNMDRYLYVYPDLSQIKRTISSYEYRPLVVFRYQNPVTFFSGILENLMSEFEEMDALFEQYVDDLILQLRHFTDSTNQQGAILFTTLNTIQTTFNTRVAEVQEILETC